MSVTTRFAPSPTGYFHIGSARTALFSWLYAKQKKGQFLLRIEDTDRARSTQSAVDVILEAMAWLQLDYQIGPIYQTERLARYEAIAQKLVAEGHAYYCHCSKEHLEALREAQLANNEKPRYDGRCRDNASAHEPTADCVIRFKNPLTGFVEFEDSVHGLCQIDNAELDDLIIMRSDKSPTYNFCVVVDDWEMGISHVFRGDDHLSNTPRQVNLLKALGAPIPIYAHVPMILGDDAKRLSKRTGALSVLQYRDMGILPQALLNYLVRLGWSHGDQEIFTQAELIENFDLQHLHKSPASFDLNKLLWLNQHYIKESQPADLAPLLAHQLQNLGLANPPGPIEELVRLQQERANTLKEMAEKSRYFFEEVHYSDEQVELFKDLNFQKFLASFIEQAARLDTWQAAHLQSLMKDILTELNLKLGQVGPIMRVALTATSGSPPLDQTIAFLGRDKTLNRLAQI